MFLAVFIFGFAYIPSVYAIQTVHGVTNACCELAVQENATIEVTNDTFNHVCGQRYSPSKHPATDIRVNLTWCTEHCPAYALYEPSDTSNWAVPLVSFILPAVIFSTQIPRSLGLKPLSRRASAAYKGRKRMWVAILFLLPDSLWMILDTTAWVFAIMIGAGPFMLSGLVELWLDYKVVCLATDGQADRKLPYEERAAAYTAILAGNLLIEGVEYDPQVELEQAFDSTNSSHEQTVNSLLSMLESQMTFGGLVGAAIFLYLGSYIFTLSTLNGTQGDQATARALAFGIWWMTIVHVSVVGGSLLASNNPSTAAAIVRRLPQRLDNQNGEVIRPSHLEDYVHARLRARSKIPLTYETRYVPAGMWSRGKNKGLWLSRTSTWKQHEWFADFVDISLHGWFWLFLTAYLLILVPCALAMWIEYRTPPVTVGCRSMTILLYMVTQTIFLLLSAWSHIKAFRDFRYPEQRCWLRNSWLRRKPVGICIAIFVLIPTFLLAVFTTFAGTLMQITGIYQNCYCGATYTWQYRLTSTVIIATDTEGQRASSSTWNNAGYSAFAALGAVSLSGWWFQSYIRDIFRDRVESLLD